MSSSKINLTARGLNFQPNQLGVDDGSMTTASNVIIRRDNVVEKRRGFKLYGSALPSPLDRVKQLLEYRDRILRHYNDKLQFDDGQGNFTDFTGTVNEVQPGLRIKSVSSNNNFYFTTSDGIKKIASQSSDLSGSSITNAGGIKATDVRARLKYTYGSSTGFLPVDSVVAYRTVWGTKDVNSNLILGSPSTITTVYNPITPVMIRDYMVLLNALDQASTTGGTLNYGLYVQNFGLDINATADDLRSQLIALTSQLDDDIFNNPKPPVSNAVYNAGPPQTIQFTITAHGLITGDYIEVKNVNPSVYDGTYQVTVIDANNVSVIYTGTLTPGAYVSGGTVRQIKYGVITKPDELSIPATAAQLKSIQNYMEAIIQELQSESSSVIPNPAGTQYIDPLAITTTSTVILDISIPEEVIAAGLNNYFLQIYRSNIKTATDQTVLQDLVPDDEMKLVYEAFPTATELAATTMTVEDVTPDAFAGANLYTNEATGEGITQANEPPPLAADIARFKNVIFYANTKTKHKKLISMLGVSNMIDDFNLGIIPKLEITNGIETVIYEFVTGLKEKYSFVCSNGATVDGKYFIIYSADDRQKYYFYYTTGSYTGPIVTDGITVPILINGTETDVQIAQKTTNTINVYPADFIATVSTNTVTVENVDYGYTTDMNGGTVGYVPTIITQGRGQSLITDPKQVLLSQSTSPAQAVDETARSLVNIINRDPNSPVYAYYISTSETVPGQILFEAKDLSSPKFYIIPNNDNTGKSFNPDLSVSGEITSIIQYPTDTTKTEITTSVNHGLVTGNEVAIAFTDSTPDINGIYTITVTAVNKFIINKSITVTGTTGVYDNTAVMESSENETKINRVYYSKLSQPEAVPIVNFFDVGDSDKSILRIYPLRDSLFVFKEEGLYRISGETAPFNLALFDSSCLLTAPDSLGVNGNIIYGWTKQGVSTVSEAGVDIASRPIDTEILKLGSNNYPSFTTSTWGLGYESDNSYLVWTIKDVNDDFATICYRYCSLTQTWTTYDKSNQCGIIKLKEDKLFLGLTDINYIEQERKTFTREDYADREYAKSLSTGNYLGNAFRFSTVSDIQVGDVLTQTQYVTNYEYDMLLKKMDIDIGFGFNQFYNTYKTSGETNIKTKIIQLCQKLDTLGLEFTDYLSSVITKTGSVIDSQGPLDTTIITQPNHGLVNNRIIEISGNTSVPSLDGQWQITVIDANTFSIPFKTEINAGDGIYVSIDTNPLDIKACYNGMINKLNVDNVVVYNNYQENDTESLLEVVILAVDNLTKIVTVNKTLQFHIGDMTLYKAFDSSFIYSPITMGDSLGLKQLSETTFMFEDKKFTIATASFATDVLPEYIPVVFNGDGTGLFGHDDFGTNFFGGGSHSTPFRTYVPRQCQRCRYLSLKFTHLVARENIAVFGTTITGRIGISTRAFRG